LSGRQSDALIEWQQYIQPAEFLRFRNGFYAFEMENRLAAMILAEPAGFQRHAPRLISATGVSGENFAQPCQAFRKISEDFCRNFSFVAARP